MGSEARPLFRNASFGRSAGLLERTSRNTIFLGTIVAFTAATIVLAQVLNLYIDEAYSLHTTDGGIRSAFKLSLIFEQQPPLYFVLLAAWRSLDHSIFFARLFSIGCCLASIFLFRRFAQRTLTNVPDWLPSLLFAFNPFVLWAALEIRVYAMILLLSTALIMFFFEAFIAANRNRSAMLTFVLVSIAAMYTHYFFAATFVGFGLILVAFRRDRVIAYVGSMAVLAIAMIPLLGTVLVQMHEASVETLASPTRLAAEVLLTLGAFVFPHGWINAMDVRLITWVYEAAFLGMLVAAFVGIRHSRTALMLTLLTASIVAFFFYIILVAREPIETPRHISTLFVPTILSILAAVTATFRTPARRGILSLYLAIFAVCAVVEDVHTYGGLAKIGDWQRVSSYLQTHARPSEPVAVFDMEDALPIRYYYRGASHIVPIPHEQAFDRFDRRDFAIRSYTELERTFPKPSPSTGVAWLVTSVPCGYALLNASCGFIDRYVREKYTTVSVAHFYRTVVYGLRARKTLTLVESTSSMAMSRTSNIVPRRNGLSATTFDLDGSSNPRVHVADRARLSGLRRLNDR